MLGESRKKKAGPPRRTEKKDVGDSMGGGAARKLLPGRWRCPTGGVRRMVTWS